MSKCCVKLYLKGGTWSKVIDRLSYFIFKHVVPDKYVNISLEYRKMVDSGCKYALKSDMYAAEIIIITNHLRSLDIFYVFDLNE